MGNFAEAVLLGHLLAPVEVLHNLDGNREYAAVVMQREALRLRVDQAAEAYQELLRDYNKLVGEYNEMLAKRNALRDENARLRMQIDEQEAYIERLQKKERDKAVDCVRLERRLRSCKDMWSRGETFDPLV